jgi:calcium-binding protein p22
MFAKVEFGQIERLYWRFLNLDTKNKGYLDRDDLTRIPGLVTNPFGERIIQLFFKDESNGNIDFTNFVLTLATFSPHRKIKDKIKINTKQQKLAFLFKIYDLENSETITPEIMLAVAQSMNLNDGLDGSMKEEKEREYIQKIFEEVDRDHDDCITFNDFCAALQKADIEQEMSLNFFH